jgi:desulfoferrodoxin (superoxide reductase-like protein)
MQKESKTNNNQVKKTEKTENEQHVPHIKPRKNYDVLAARLDPPCY